MEIKKVVVIGSGTMGSGIAAHLCNANIPVTLLDLKTEISEKARDRIHKSKPPLLIDKSKINNIKVGNISDNFSEVAEADWVVEAVVERIDIKHDIYEKIFKVRKKGAIVSSNTSSIPIKVLSQHLSEEEKKDFCITHFFNPVRYMGLLEIVKNENNNLDKCTNARLYHQPHACVVPAGTYTTTTNAVQDHITTPTLRNVIQDPKFVHRGKPELLVFSFVFSTPSVSIIVSSLSSHPFGTSP